MSLEGEEQRPDGYNNTSGDARLLPSHHVPWQQVNTIESRQKPWGSWRERMDLA